MNARAQTRRGFLRDSTILLAGLTARPARAARRAPERAVRIGLMTDLHHADKPERRTRYYRHTLDKLREAVEVFNRSEIDLAVELGDLIDQAPALETEIAWLKTVEAVFAGVRAPRHYVLGNHCVGTLTKAEFAAHTAASKSPHYSFDVAGIHLVVLDSCYTSAGIPYQRDNFDWKDANVPEAELAWLREDLARADTPAIVFAHQRLDRDPAHSVRNADRVRAILERSGRVMAVFQGHSHANAYQRIGGIHYCTLVAMVEGPGPESSGYALLEILPDAGLRLTGFRRQTSRAWESTSPRAGSSGPGRRTGSSTSN